MRYKKLFEEAMSLLREVLDVTYDALDGDNFNEAQIYRELAMISRRADQLDGEHESF